MEDLTFIIGQNFKRIRESKNMSLDKVSKATGVSKSMLGQIERGESNPTITTVWKIAKGLKVSFTTLLEKPEIDTELIDAIDLDPLIENDGKYKLYAYFQYEEDRNFEMYRVLMEPDGYLAAESHGEGVQEFITVFNGELTLTVDTEDYTVSKGSGFRFKADKKHAYKNKGSVPVELSMIIYYPIDINLL